jgi:exosortase
LMLAALVLLIAALFAPLLVPVELAWRRDQNYSHGYLVPLICLALALRAWGRAGPPVNGEKRMALLTLVPGAFLLLAATLVPWPLITFASLCLILRGTAVAIGGRTWAAHFTAPILFSFFMFPVPVTWTAYAALWLQDIVSRISAMVIDLFIVCRRTGTILQLAGVSQSLYVGEECSGLRQLVGFLAFAVLLGLILDRSAWKRLTLVALAIPIAVIANVVRVLIMSAGAYHFGTSWMTGWLHYAPAAFTIPVGFGVLIALDWLLNRRSTMSLSASNTRAAENGPAVSAAARLRPVLVCLAAAFVVQIILKVHLNAAGPESFPPMRQPLADLPTQFGTAWHGEDRSDTAEVRKQLPFEPDDIIYRDYRLAGTNLVVQVYAVHSRIGEDRKHHPEICIREVTGAPEDLADRRMIALDPAEKRAVQRFVFRTTSVGRTTVYYWHYTFLAPTTNNSFLQTLHQRLGEHPPSLTVEVLTTTDDPRELQAIEAGFLPAVDDALAAKSLPLTALIDANRLPVALIRE